MSHSLTVTYAPVGDGGWAADRFSIRHHNSLGDALSCPCACAEVVDSVRDSGSVDGIAADHVGLGSIAGTVTVPVALRCADGQWTVREDWSGTVRSPTTRTTPFEEES